MLILALCKLILTLCNLVVALREHMTSVLHGLVLDTARDGDTVRTNHNAAQAHASTVRAHGGTAQAKSVMMSAPPAFFQLVSGPVSGLSELILAPMNKKSLVIYLICP